MELNLFKFIGEVEHHLYLLGDVEFLIYRRDRNLMLRISLWSKDKRYNCEFPLEEIHMLLLNEEDFINDICDKIRSEFLKDITYG